MASTVEKLEALRSAAEERGLTPVAWWIGEHHHERALEELSSEEGVEVEVQAERLTRIEGLDVKLLTESPARFALWCEEGALDL